jgi:hypothetical protein
MFCISLPGQPEKFTVKLLSGLGDESLAPTLANQGAEKAFVGSQWRKSGIPRFDGWAGGGPSRMPVDRCVYTCGRKPRINGSEPTLHVQSNS